MFNVSDYLQDGRSTSVQGPDLENQNSLDSGESCLFVKFQIDHIRNVSHI